MDAGGIELFGSRRVRVRLPDCGVNARSDLRDGRVHAWFGLAPETSAGAPAGVVVPIASLGDAIGVTTRRTISAKIAAIATLIWAIRARPAPRRSGLDLHAFP